MKLKNTILRAGFALVLAVPLLSSVSPVSRASEAGISPRFELARSASTVGDWAQVDSSSVQPGGGTPSSQSVGGGGGSGGSSTPGNARPSSNEVGPNQAQPAGPSASSEDDPFAVETAPDGKPARAGSLIVTFKPGVQTSSRDSAHRGVQVQSVEPIGSGSAFRVQVQSGTTAQAISTYQGRADVQSVEPDYMVYADMTPNDPRYRDQWGPAKMQAPAAWDRVGGATGVKVAVLDTGMAAHPDLVGRIVASADFTGSPYGAADRHGHGTHTAGTVAASANNSVGVVGVAYGASLMNAKVLGDSGAGSLSSVASGMVWAADNGAKVISMSLGANLDCTSTIQDAANYAWSKGVVLFAAAGNDGINDVHTPANCNHIVPVGATESNDTRASFSNYGSGVPIAAPGVMIISTGKDGDYTWMSGTSMATPHAAGVAALIWATSYATSNQAVVNRLFSTADRVAGTGSNWVYGRVNAAAAVGAGGAGTTPTPTPTPSEPPVSCSPRPPVAVRSTRTATGTLKVTVTASATVSGVNRLQQVRFGPGANASIDVGARAESTGSFDVNVPSGVADYSFTIRRVQAGPVTVPLTIVDACGEWKTFVGGGAGAF